MYLLLLIHSSLVCQLIHRKLVNYCISCMTLCWRLSLFDGKIRVKKTGCSVEYLLIQRRRAEYMGSSITKVSNSKSKVNSLSAVEVLDPDFLSKIKDLHINHSIIE